MDLWYILLKTCNRDNSIPPTTNWSSVMFLKCAESQMENAANTWFNICVIASQPAQYILTFSKYHVVYIVVNEPLSWTSQLHYITHTGSARRVCRLWIYSINNKYTLRVNMLTPKGKKKKKRRWYIINLQQFSLQQSMLWLQWHLKTKWPRLKVSTLRNCSIWNLWWRKRQKRNETSTQTLSWVICSTA